MRRPYAFRSRTPILVVAQNFSVRATAPPMSSCAASTYVILRGPTYVILRGPTYVILRGPTYVILRGPTYVILRAVAGSGRGPRHRQRDSATARRMTPESLFSPTRLLAPTRSGAEHQFWLWRKISLRGPTYVILRGPTYVILRGLTYVILRGPTYVILRAVAGSGRGPRHRQRDSATARRMTPESLFSLTRLLGPTSSCGAEHHLCHPALWRKTYVILYGCDGPTYVILRGPPMSSCAAPPMSSCAAPPMSSCAQSQDPGEVRAIASEILRLRAE